MKAEFPENEALRLATLKSYHILDTSPEPPFDDLTLLATQICQTPIAQISFIDEKRQWFKSQIGLNLNEVARDDAFVAQILNSDKIIAVPDVRLDLRFADDPLVTGDANIVFYASVPIITQNNYVLGTLNVCDFVAKELSHEQKQALQALGRQVLSMLELRKSISLQQQTAKERNRLFNQALDLYCIADFNGYFKQVNRAWETTLGWTNEELLAKPYMEFIHPDDHEVSSNAVTTVKDGKKLQSFHNRYLCKDGSYRWFSWVAYPDTEEGLIIAVARDISEQKNEQQRFQDVTEASPIGLVMVDDDGIILLVNRQTEALFDYTREELVGQSATCLLPERFRASFPEKMQLFFDDPSSRAVGDERDLYGLRKDGSEFALEIALSPLNSKQGKTVLATVVNISKRKQAELALKKLQRHHELILVSIGEGLHGIDRDGTIIFENPAAIKMLGYEGEQALLGQPAHVVLHHTQLDGSHYSSKACHISATLKDGLTRRIEDEVFWRKDGTSFPVTYICTPMIDEAGNIEGVIVSFQDITEQNKMRRSLTQFKSTLDQTVDCVFICNSKNFRFEYVNEGAIQQVGYSETELLGMTVPDIKPEYSFEKYQFLIQQLLEGKQSSLTFETIHKHKNGSKIPVEITIQAVRQGFKTPRLVAVVRDISDRKQAEKILRIKNDELKSFAYTVSHDLKAPLRGISGYAQELERRHKEGLSERAQFCIDQIITASNNLDCLIEELLVYSRVESETPTVTAVDLATLLKGIMKDRSLVIAEQNIELIIDVSAITLQVWERGLHQVLTNLVDNAIKYSRHAKPANLSISAEKIGDSCIIAVKDNGVGFDMKYHDRIFGLFNRLVRADEFEGTGAGLAIVKKLLNKLGGSIRAESEPGLGATFFVELPMTLIRNPLS
jgi:PAS domain S-box-containing protein